VLVGTNAPRSPMGGDRVYGGIALLESDRQERWDQR
jgi:hypothetical protein